MSTQPTDAEIDELWRFEASKNWDSTLAMRTNFTRAALARWGQPAHSGEPVAYYQPDDPSSSSAFSWPGSERNTAHNKPLFTAPQPVEREPLTDEQSHALLHRMADESDKWAEGLSYEPTREQVSGWCVAFLMRELPAHGIKGGQHG